MMVLFAFVLESIVAFLVQLLIKQPPGLAASSFREAETDHPNYYRRVSHVFLSQRLIRRCQVKEQVFWFCESVNP